MSDERIERKKMFGCLKMHRQIIKNRSSQQHDKAEKEDNGGIAVESFQPIIDEKIVDGPEAKSQKLQERTKNEKEIPQLTQQQQHLRKTTEEKEEQELAEEQMEKEEQNITETDNDSNRQMGGLSNILDSIK